MSMATLLPPTSPVVRCVQLFIAPVSRGTQGNGGIPNPSLTMPFDPAVQGRFALAAPPAGWLSLGTVHDFVREDTSSFAEMLSGAPAIAKTRARNRASAAVRFTLPAWSKLGLALSGGSQQMNLLRELPGSTGGVDSGGQAGTAVPVLAGSTANVLLLPGSAPLQPGDLIVVDDDAGAATAGFVGAGAQGGYVRSAADIGNSPDYVRRVSFNVGGVTQVTAAANNALQITLAAPLPAGVPTATNKLAALQGFVDRVGGSFVQEWSALFVMDGVQGDRVLLHYPRLQPAGGMPTEVKSNLAPGLDRWRLQAHLTALPVTDVNDGEPVLCFRSYLPAPMRTA